MAQDETSLLVKADVSSHVASQNAAKRPHAENPATICCSADLFCLLGKVGVHVKVVTVGTALIVSCLTLGL